MNFKKYHVSRNLLSPTPNANITYNASAGRTVATTAGNLPCSFSNDTLTFTPSTVWTCTAFMVECIVGNTYVFSTRSVGSGLRLSIYAADSSFAVSRLIKNLSGSKYIEESVTINSGEKYIVVSVTASTSDTVTLSNPMLNTGSQPLPYEPYSSEVWHDTPHYIHNTATDTITTLPADIYANDTTVTVGLKGNMSQSSTPTPSSPVQPSECGDLETEGAHTGQYKIPILSNSTITPVYLGEVQTTRKIKKIIFDGQDDAVTLNTVDTNRIVVRKTIIAVNGQGYCSHLGNNVTGNNKFVIAANSIYLSFALQVIGGNTLADVNAYFAQQYAAGTPVTVWYVLATAETGIVNEPLRKIGDYADEVSGITIPVTAGANTLSVDTTLQPSEVTATYKGWHPVADVHERESGAWT